MKKTYHRPNDASRVIWPTCLSYLDPPVSVLDGMRAWILDTVVMDCNMLVVKRDIRNINNLPDGGRRPGR